MKVDVLSDVVVSNGTAEMGLGLHCAYPACGEAPDGLILCVYRAGSQSHSYDGVTCAQTSSDQGRTWSQPVVLFDRRHTTPAESLVQPVALAPRDGLLLALTPTVVAGSTCAHPLVSEAGLQFERRCYKCHSVDDGRTWSQPELLTHLAGLSLAGKSCVLPDGHLFINAARTEPVGLRMNMACFSSDHGRTIGPPVELFQDPQWRWAYDEANYTTFPDGTMLGLYWTWRVNDPQSMKISESAPVHRSVSSDLGRTWALPAATNLVGQISSPAALDDRTVLVASNYRYKPPGIRLWISHDRGQSFNPDRVLQMWDPQAGRITARAQETAPPPTDQGTTNAFEAFTFGLPELHRLADATLLMTYWCTCQGDVQVRACRFRLAES